MITFIKIMMGLWAGGIVIALISQCYVSAILCFVFLLQAISELHYQKEYNKIMASIEVQQRYIDKCSEIIRRKNEI